MNSRGWEFCDSAAVGQKAAIRYRCPCCQGEGILPLRGRMADTGQTMWEWDGNADAPTLTPSIRRTHTCGWHGHLTAGSLVTA
jgi:hypothetical protein